MMINEFKKFILRGNVIDLAVGVIIGGAFNQIVSAIVNDIFLPFLSLFTKGLNFEGLFFTLDGKHYPSAQAAIDQGIATVNVGSFLSAILNFLIMSFVVFLIVYLINKLKDASFAVLKSEPTPEPTPEPTTKICPFCLSEIDIKATRCKYCTSIVEND